MKKVNVEDAVGMKLCHDITAISDNFKGPIFKRNHIITFDDIEKLLNCGKKHIFVWEDEINEMHEEDAAKNLSLMTEVKYGHYTDVSEGKILLVSDIDGLFVVDETLLHKVNSIGDITITTINNHYHIHKGQRLVSMRVVPLVVEKWQIDKAKELCDGKKLYDIIPFKHKKVGIIITGSEVYSGRIKDKFEPVCREKLSKFDSEILGVKICDDDLAMIENAGKTFIDEGADILIFTGGMSVDPDDLTPKAIKNLGANIISYGVPAQPGNMTLVAYKDDIAIIGVPGAAVKLPTTIFDVLLPQLFTDLKITKENLINIAVGGLCELCEKCHYPNCNFGKY